ncbi:Dyp-type peroxidase [Streptomyces sp. NPDC050428]|uniref:Dyp-type peroxidase n=1 Tax=Streptomyces sp. NPDC050428 TaxID=3155757 RepID=UPI0034206D99
MDLPPTDRGRVMTYATQAPPTYAPADGGGEADLPLRTSREIQGDIIAGAKKDHVQLLLLKFENDALARTWLRRLRPRIATTRQVAAFNAEFSKARKQSGGDDPKALNAVWRVVSFTYPGLKLLAGRDPFPSVPPDSTQEAFKEGPAARAAMLGDTGQCAPEHWLFGNGASQPLHAVLTVSADRPQDLRVALTEEREEAARHKVVIVFEQDGATLEGTRRGKEHFGFKDGISEPAVKGFDPPDQYRPEHKKGSPGTRIIPAGEIVVGHERDDGKKTDLPDWARNGSFQVVRRLAQDVPGWWAQIAERLKELKLQEAVPPEATTEWLAARMVGRWRSGTPVAKCPHADSPSDAEAWSDNDISYRDDLEGEITPLFSHLRQTSPRDGLLVRSTDTETVPEKGGLDGRRIMRRGIPYGRPFDPAGGAGNGPDAPRGLVFVCYQADLVRQFEFIQKDWIEEPNFPQRTPAPGRDPLVATATDVNFKGCQVRFEQFVRTEGAVYAFSPSLTTIEHLADGKLDGGGDPGGDRILTAPFTLRPADGPVGPAKARLVMREDGNLVVLDESDQARWESGTAGSGGARATFQEDGDIVVLTTGDRPVWKSRTTGNPGAKLILLTDGNVVIRAADGTVVWQTNTAH